MGSSSTTVARRYSASGFVRGAERGSRNHCVRRIIRDGPLFRAVLQAGEDFWAGHPDWLQRILKVMDRLKDRLSALDVHGGRGSPRLAGRSVCTGGLMTTRAEERLAHSLRAVLADLPAGADILDSEQFRVPSCA